MKKIMIVGIMGLLLFPAISFAQVAPTSDTATLIASIRAEIAILEQIYLILLQQESSSTPPVITQPVVTVPNPVIQQPTNPVIVAPTASPFMASAWADTSNPSVDVAGRHVLNINYTLSGASEANITCFDSAHNYATGLGIDISDSTTTATMHMNSDFYVPNNQFDCTIAPYIPNTNSVLATTTQAFTFTIPQ